MAYVESNRDDLERWAQQDCDSCPGGSLCHSETMYAGESYPWCPTWRRSRADWQGIVHVYNTIQVQPRADWPDGLAAYVSAGVMALDRAVAKRISDKASQS